MPPKRAVKKSPTKSQTLTKEFDLSSHIRDFADHLIDTYSVYPSTFVNRDAFRTEVKKILVKNLGQKLNVPSITKLIEGIHREYEINDDLDRYNSDVLEEIIEELTEDQPKQLISVGEALDKLFYPNEGYPNVLEHWEYYVKLLIDTLIFLFNLEKEKGNPYLADVELQDYQGLGE